MERKSVNLQLLNRGNDVMKKIMKTLILLLIAIGLSNAGDITKKGTNAAQFLKIGVGARASAMGESYVAEANDASALFWNPAGLAKVQSNEVMFVRTDWIAGLTYDFAAVVMPFAGIGTFGLYYQGLNMDDMEVRTEYKPEGTGEFFTVSSFALGLSYAKNMTEKFAFGIGFKFIQETIWHESASAMAIDIGITYDTVIEDLRLGMAIANYGGKMQLVGKDLLTFNDIDPNLDGNNENVIARLNTEKYDIPISFRVGFAYDPIKTDFHRVTVTLDGVTPNDYNEYLNVGFEYGFREMVFLRSGYKGIGIVDSEVGFSAGGGLNYSLDKSMALVLDYAYVNFGRFNNVQRFSIKLVF